VSPALKTCAVGAAVFLAAVVQSSSAASHRRNGRIVFSRAGGLIWSVKASGKGLHPLTPPGSYDAASPAFAPNGKRIVYAKYACGDSGSNCVRSDLWLMHADGSHQSQLTSTTLSETEPAWSPNGRQIAYEETSGGPDSVSYGIWVMNADGSEPHQVTHSGTSAAWSPDGTRIAYVANNHVLVLSLRTGKSRNLTPGHVYARDPAWSPDGRRIVFSLEDDLTVMNANGGHRHSLTRT